MHVLRILTPELMLSERCCPPFVCPFLSISGVVFQWLGQSDVTSEGPPLSPGDGAKGNGSLGCARGELRQTEYRTKCYQLSLPCADGVRHGWANLTASKGTRGTALSTCVNICACVCVCVPVQDCRCAHTAGVRGPASERLLSRTSHHFMPLMPFPPLNILAIKAEQTD